MFSEIPAPPSADLEHIASVSFWGKKRIEVYWNNHAGMALFKELKNTRREIVHVTDDETQEYVRSRAHLIVDNHFNMYTLEYQNEPKWHECDDSTNVVVSLKHFVASAVAEPHHLIFNNIEHVHKSTGERRPASDMYTVKMYELTWRDVSRSWLTTLSLNVRNYTWLENVHYQRATHIVYSRCAEGEEPDKDAIRKMALQFHIDAAKAELEEMRLELERKEANVQHMQNELAE
jgi:hypothetical protein